ncbi:MAG: thiamine phosphate synthase [Alphaproteobacteria bacterium]
MDLRETHCQLYLIIPPDMDQRMVVDIAAAGSTGNIACALLRADTNGKIDRRFGTKILRVAQFSHVPIVFENDVAAAADLGADGVHLFADEEKYCDARRILGDDAIIGVDCGLSRHDGLTFGEMGADYIAFTDSIDHPPCWNGLGLEELLIWWSETVTVPSVAWDISSAAAARRYAQAGADFVAMGEPVWSHVKGPANATAEFSATLTAQQISV